MAARTILFDELILSQVEKGADMVVNLAAGLDARPYRLPLPPALTWVEVDLPGLLDYKAEVLANDKPACVLERVPLDLSDAAARRDLFDQLGRRASRPLIVSEGLLIYLSRGSSRRARARSRRSPELSTMDPRSRVAGSSQTDAEKPRRAARQCGSAARVRTRGRPRVFRALRVESGGCAVASQSRARAPGVCRSSCGFSPCFPKTPNGSDRARGRACAWSKRAPAKPRG